MPRKYKRKTDRASYSEDKIQNAIAAIKSGRSIREVGKSFNIAEATLRFRMRHRENTNMKLGRKPVFTEEQESDLGNHVLKLAKLFFGISKVELRKLAYSFAEANNVKHNFDKSSKMAGKDWLEGFLARNNRISLRKPEATSINRVTGFNKEAVDEYFKNLTEVMLKKPLSPERIYNVDETGITNVQKPQKILGPKGQKQVGAITSLERGRTVTVVCCMSASGHYIAPLFIFPRARMSPHLQKDGPVGAQYHCSKNGWINEEIFFEWLQHSHNSVTSSLENPVLLVLDNHTSHISLRIHEFCRNKGIILLSIPPHTSHRLQPLDLTFYGPLKGTFGRECDLFMRINAYQKITHYHLANLFNKAYLKTATMEKAISGFRAAGIWPLDAEKINSLLIDDFNQEAFKLPTIEQDEQVTQQNKVPKAASEVEPVASTSTAASVSIEEISPLPTYQKKSKTEGNNRRKQKSEILTATPMKRKLEELQEKNTKKAANTGKAKKLKKLPKNTRKKVKSKAKKLDFDDEDSEVSSVDEAELCADTDQSDGEFEETDKDKCLVCGEFGRNNEVWYRCVSCGLWAHKNCSGAYRAENYKCDYCC